MGETPGSRMRHSIAAVLVAAATWTAAGPSIWAQSDVKRQQLQKQQDLRKQRIIERQRQLRESLKSESGTAPASNDAGDEAQAIYRNLRRQQNLSHEAAISRLKGAGYPTDRIEALP